MAYGGDSQRQSRSLASLNSPISPTSARGTGLSPAALIPDRADIKLTKPHSTMMYIGADRVVYAGLLGQPEARSLGALAVYCSVGAPFNIRIDGGPWESTEFKVVPPEVPHAIVSENRMIGCLMIEPESVDAERLPAFLRHPYPAPDDASIMRRVREAFARLTADRAEANLLLESVDQLFFGEELPKRKLDGRMATVIERIKTHPGDLLGAEDYALMVGLSFSRFLHLFKEEVGTTFRSFRAWKRARNFLAYVQANLNLTAIALETGYPDSSHFSHTVRRYWGLTPKDIIAGSRRLAIISQSDRRGFAAGR
jgi:AraC-like DNA-binding protein